MTFNYYDKAIISHKPLSEKELRNAKGFIVTITKTVLITAFFTATHAYIKKHVSLGITREQTIGIYLQVGTARLDIFSS